MLLLNRRGVGQADPDSPRPTDRANGPPWCNHAPFATNGRSIRAFTNHKQVNNAGHSDWKARVQREWNRTGTGQTWKKAVLYFCEEKGGHFPDLHIHWGHCHISAIKGYKVFLTCRRVYLLSRRQGCRPGGSWRGEDGSPELLIRILTGKWSRLAGGRQAVCTPSIPSYLSVEWSV